MADRDPDTPCQLLESLLAGRGRHRGRERPRPGSLAVLGGYENATGDSGEDGPGGCGASIPTPPGACSTSR
jgi:hypothetical protein